MRKVALLALAVLGGCPAQYEPRNFIGGYTSTKISPGRYIVAADCNWFNDFEEPVFFVYWRAQQLCEKNGFEEFEVESDRRPGNNAIIIVRCKNAPRGGRGEDGKPSPGRAHHPGNEEDNRVAPFDEPRRLDDDDGDRLAPVDQH